VLLSVKEAATLLEQSPRAVRARLARGDLPGRKRGGRWVIPRSALPLTEAQHRALQARADEIREVVDRALPSRAATRREHKRRSVVDARTFQAAMEARRLLTAAAGEAIPHRARALEAVSEGTLCLAEGFHQYAGGVRLEALTRARAAFARAVGLVLLDASLPLSGPACAVLEQLEQELMPPLGGSCRQAERAARRGERR